MKGIVFNEFYQFVERGSGEEVLDEVIVAADLPHAGGYTDVGTYPFDEMLSLVGAYNRISGQAVPCMMDGFGQHCFASWVQTSPGFFAPGRALFDILQEIDGFHERVVRKLYPEAELPSFVTEARSDDLLVLGYHSSKHLDDLAIGVIKGAARHMGQPVAIVAEPAQGADGPYTRLQIRLSPTASGGAGACPHPKRS